MKREYTKPAIQVVEVKNSAIICASNVVTTA